MDLQSVGSTSPLTGSQLSSTSYSPFASADTNSNSALSNDIQSPTGGVSLTGQYYQSTQFAMDFTSSDGDRVSLSYQSVEYLQASVSVQGNNGTDSTVNDMSSYLKDQLLTLKKEILDSLSKNTGGTADSTPAASAADTTGKLDIPEYWNADNTSQRIVDFATSFSSAFKGQGADFLKTIKDAIEKGFNEAESMLGKLPDSVAGLLKDTYDQIMKKLDSWAASNGIQTDDTQTDQASSSDPATQQDAVSNVGALAA